MHWDGGERPEPYDLSLLVQRLRKLILRLLDRESKGEE